MIRLDEAQGSFFHFMPYSNLLNRKKALPWPILSRI